MDLAVAEGDRQGDVVGQSLLAQLVEQREGELASGQVEPLADRARRPRTARASGCSGTGRSARCRARRETPGSRRRRAASRSRCRTAADGGCGSGRRRARAAAPCSTRRMHSSVRSARPSGSRRASPISQSRTGPGRRGQCSAPAAAAGRVAMSAAAVACRPVELVEPARAPWSAPGWCDAGARPARASPRSRSAGTG